MENLQTDTTYQKWYNSSYEEYTPNLSNTDWAKELSELEVEIYLGTWCGDSKNWVPKFVKLWEELGLDHEQLHFTALYGRVDGELKYKQGPNREEKGLGIHRVPTFIFKKDGEEIARMVEYPVNSLETDLAQIALGYPSSPNYRAATYMLDLFASQSMEEIKANEVEHLYEAYELINGNRSELNTLGFVLLESDRIEEALMVFNFNTRYFPNDPRAYESFADALVANDQIEEAIRNYDKVLLLDRSNTDVRGKLNEIYSR